MSIGEQGFGIRFITRDVIAQKHDKLGRRRHPPERGIDLSEVPLVPLALLGDPPLFSLLFRVAVS